jgi:drug/metabolite transporter superfamily protein YnfA
MFIIGLDVGRRMGFAEGEAGSKHPHSGSAQLGKVRAGIDESFGELLQWLDDAFRRRRPDLVAVEAPLSLRAYTKLGTAEDAVRAAYGQHAIIEAICWRWGIERVEVPVLTVRKHFTGKASHRGREFGKVAVISRCIQLGYVGRDEDDDNRCDALAVWDWASATIGKKPPEELVLFNA